MFEIMADCESGAEGWVVANDKLLCKYVAASTCNLLTVCW
jgi:hypothetical protein